MPNIIGVSLRKQVWSVDVDAGDLELKNDDMVVIETKSGQTVGKVIPRIAYKCGKKPVSKTYSRALRMASADDLRQEELNIRMEKNYFQACKKSITKHSLPMKLVDVAIALDGNKVVFFFVSENRVDFRSLVKELASDLRIRIEMRQIGARSEAQRIGGMGFCGRKLCCETFLQKFCPVTVKMTKEQGLPLDPEKISGVCGRLMCCLAYEHETYVEMRKGMPKIGRKVKTPQGTGKVRQINVISKKVYVALDDGSTVEVHVKDCTTDIPPEKNRPVQRSNKK